MVQENERRWRPDADTRAGLLDCWRVMREGDVRGRLAVQIGVNLSDC